jgi:small-conductance mechanosensitive channel
MFNLDEGQRTAAVSCLSDLKQRAIAHRDRRREDIARLEYRIEHKTATDVPLDDLKKQLSELYGPIDDMFKELQTRLDQIPTVLQREAVAKRQQPIESETIAAPKP